MGFFDINEEHGSAKVQDAQQERLVEVRLPGCEEFVPISRFQVKRVYADDLGPRLLLVCDEMVEVMQKTKLKTTEGREEDAMKDEISTIIQSITQLGRSAGIHMVLCTQRNDTSTLNGIIQNNPLHIETKLRVRTASA